MAENRQENFQYWIPGERRKLRVFVSHRWGDDDGPLYDRVMDHLKSQGFNLQDLSLNQNKRLAGPRGGNLSQLELQREIAARIYTSDVLIVPSRPGVSRSAWVTWEVQLATVGYGLPVLFVDYSKDARRRTALINGLKRAGAKFDVCANDPFEIAAKVAVLAGDTFRTMRFSEDDVRVAYRGPLPGACSDMLNRFPFEPNDRQPSRN